MEKKIKRLDGNNWEESFIEIYDDENLEFHERDLSELVWSNPIDEIKGENRRWSRSVESIIKMKGRYFSICWEEGLTEMQEHEFYNQPVEVEKVEEKITVTKWNRIGDDK